MLYARLRKRRKQMAESKPVEAEKPTKKVEVEDNDKRTKDSKSSTKTKR